MTDEEFKQINNIIKSIINTNKATESRLLNDDLNYRELIYNRAVSELTASILIDFKNAGYYTEGK